MSEFEVRRLFFKGAMLCSFKAAVSYTFGRFYEAFSVKIRTQRRNLALSSTATFFSAKQAEHKMIISWIFFIEVHLRNVSPFSSTIETQAGLPQRFCAGWKSTANDLLP